MKYLPTYSSFRCGSIEFVFVKQMMTMSESQEKIVPGDSNETLLGQWGHAFFPLI